MINLKTVSIVLSLVGAGLTIAGKAIDTAEISKTTKRLIDEAVDKKVAEKMAQIMAEMAAKQA